MLDVCLLVSLRMTYFCRHAVMLIMPHAFVLQMVCRQMTSSELLSVAPTQLLPGSFAAFHHPRPDVRKAVTFCLVDMWLAAGEG